MFTVLKKRSKFSVENLLHQCDLLQKNTNVNEQNVNLVISVLQQISELMIWGDQNDETFFDIIAENNILDIFIKIIKQKFNALIIKQVLQTLSIVIENISNTKSLYHMFSNNYINDLIIYPFNFKNTEILGYYIILLRQISSKLDENIINFFFNSKTNDFPLWCMSIGFFSNENQTVRTKVMQIILNIFKVSTKHKELKQFILDASFPYFLNLISFVKNDCFQLNASIAQKQNNLANKIRAHIDFYYYLEDIASFKIDSLTQQLMNQFLAHLVLPVFVGSLTNDSDDEKMDNTNVSKHLSLFLLTQILTIFSDAQLKNAVIVSLTCKNPLKLLQQIISSPPDINHAIHTRIPIQQCLSLGNVEMSMKQRLSMAEMDNDTILSENYNRSETMKHVLDNDENDKIKRSHIKRITKVDIINKESIVRELSNIYRDKILEMFDFNTNGNNELLIIGIASLIFTVLSDDTCMNEYISEDCAILITKIINILANYFNLSAFTLRLLTELLKTLNNLNSEHSKALQSICKCATNELSEHCIRFVSNDESMLIWLLDTMEQEWNIEQRTKQEQMRSLIANPDRVIVQRENKRKKTNDYQQEITDKLEKIRLSIRHFLYFLTIKNEVLSDTKIELPFIARSEWKYYNRLQVPLGLLAAGCLNTLVLYDSDLKRERVLFSTREPNWLLLFNRISNSKGLCVIYLAVPIHNVQCINDKYDPRIMRLTVKSDVCPHSKIAIPVSKSKNCKKWIITLFFDSMFDTNQNTNNKHVLIAMEYITMNRMRVRRKMMTKIEELINNQDDQ